MELVTRAVVIGEGMIELVPSGSGWTLGHGGDCLNTAVHLARLGVPVGFVSALGTDAFSQTLRRAWRDEGIDTALVLTDPARQPGLYAISTDESGERSFTYWRDNSAARQMFALPGIEAVLEQAAQADLLYYSLITLAILPSSARSRLFLLCREIRKRGGLVAFDGNYRPRLWQSPDEARALRDSALTCCDIGLPTLADEALMAGFESAGEVARHWMAEGAREVVVKLGDQGCLCPDGQIHPPPARLRPVDTTGAGDAFNAGYLQARLAGAPAAAAAAAGHRLAGWVVSRPGAIPSQDSDFDYPAVAACSAVGV